MVSMQGHIDRPPHAPIAPITLNPVEKIRVFDLTSLGRYTEV